MLVKRKLLMVVGLVLFFVVSIVLFILASQPNVPAETEIDSPGTVVIDNTDSLRTILLPSQYTLVINEIVSFIQSTIDPVAEHAVVIDTPKVQRDGTIDAIFQVDGQSKPFTLYIDRSAFDKIVLTVPSHDYIKTIEIY